jgi:hypothetical protein
MQRGWPLAYLVRTNAPSLQDEDDYVALACDFAFAGILTIAAWNLPCRWRWRFSIADILAIATSLGVTMAFQMRMWDDVLDSLIIAIDVGVFSTGMMSLRFVRKLITTLRGPAQTLQAGDARVVA